MDHLEPNSRERLRQQRVQQSLLALARKIRASRERRGLTQEDFAARCGISVSFASLLERGERSPSYETLVEVAAALDVSLAELFRESPAESYDDPYFGRLVDYARQARLTRQQVDRLIAVGRAMLGMDPAPSSSRATPVVEGGCTIDGCHKAVLAKGLCASHYHRARRARL